MAGAMTEGNLRWKKQECSDLTVVRYQRLFLHEIHREVNCGGRGAEPRQLEAAHLLLLLLVPSTGEAVRGASVTFSSSARQVESKLCSGKPWVSMCILCLTE